MLQKKMWTKVLEDNDSLNFLSQLGEGSLTDDLHIEAEKFVCKMYGDKRAQSVNGLRTKLFWSRLRKNGKVVDLSLLPPCSSTLKKHTARSHYIAKIWRLASFPVQCLDSFLNNGWLIDGNIDWIECPYPSVIEKLFGDKNESSVAGIENETDEIIDADDDDDDDDESDIEEDCEDMM